MTDKQKFSQYLKGEKKKSDYISKCNKLYDRLFESLGAASPELIGEFAKCLWSGYTVRDKMIYDFLNAYADFSEKENAEIATAISEHIKTAFEGLSKKAVGKYRREMVFIPDDAEINPLFLDGMTNDEFVTAFREWQEMISAMYAEVENGSPYAWGFPGWEEWTVIGVNQSRIMEVFKVLVECSELSNDILLVDKKSFGKACNPLHMAKLTLEKFADRGFSIEGLDEKKSQVFTVAFHDTPRLISVMYSYFMHQAQNCIGDCKKCMKKCWHHVRDFSYRYMEASDRPPQETYYLAHTEGKKAREIYDYLHNEAVAHDFLFQGELADGGLLYKKGGKIWLLAGGGSSYHEVDYLFDPDYEIAVKVQFKRIFDKIPDVKETLTARFPRMLTRKRSCCWKCREECKKRVCFAVDGEEKHFCNTFVFANPTLDDVKFLLELFKIEKGLAK